jgi:hypothetical protein
MDYYKSYKILMEKTLITQLQPDSNIPLQVYELATSHGIGTPLKGQRRRVIQILIIVVGIFMLWWLGYTIYGYIALHDNSWQDMLQYAATLLGLMSQYSIFSSAFRTKLYVCTDGLLKIYKQKDEAVRWDEVKELYMANGNVTRLVKQDGSDFLLPQLLMSGGDKTLNTLIIDEVTRCLLPGMLASYERGETVTFGGLEINQKGIYRPGGMVYWRQMGDIALEKQMLSVYYSKLDNGPEQFPTVFAGKWHTWRKSALTLTSWPNLPVFVALVNAIRDQRGVNQMEKAPLSQQPRTLVTSGNLPHARNAYLITVDVTDSVVSLRVDHTKVTSINDSTYTSTDQLELALYGSQNAHEPITALFSDFSYLPSV